MSKIYILFLFLFLFLPFKAYASVDFSASPSAEVIIPDHSDLRVERFNKFTWTAWLYFKQTDNNELPFIMQKGANYTCIMGDQTNLRRNEFGAEIVSGSNALATEYWGSTRISAGQWYFYAFTFNNGTATHWINGQQEMMTILANPYQSPIYSTFGSPFNIGNRDVTLNRNFPGLIAKVRFYQNKVLTQKNIQREQQYDDYTQGLVGKWDFNENIGTTVHDSSGKGHDGIITGGAEWSSLH